jgi:hypothetical protein
MIELPAQTTPAIQPEAKLQKLSCGFVHGVALKLMQKISKNQGVS